MEGITIYCGYSLLVESQNESPRVLRNVADEAVAERAD